MGEDIKKNVDLVGLGVFKQEIDTLLDGKISASQKGANNGVATLDNTGKVPSSQLPSYVDDVLEFTNRQAFPQEGEGGKIYTDLSTNTTWRWAGSTYQQIKGDVVIGTTTGTAFDGAAGAAMQQKVNGIAAGAEVNTIETIKINGSAVNPDANKAVNIEVPVVSYATEADIRALFN
jgi:hypothetical protein